MAEKLFYSMGEVTEMLDVKPSLVRFWGTKFTCLKPKRNQKGNRMFTPQDVANLKLIYHLVKEKNMTLEGAAKVIKAEKIASSDKSGRIAAIEKLQLLRSQLMAIKHSLGTDVDDLAEETDCTVEAAPLQAEESVQTVTPAEENTPAGKAESDVQSSPSDITQRPRTRRRKTARKPQEQSLFKDPELF